jgi:hypothetical protein
MSNNKDAYPGLYNWIFMVRVKIRWKYFSKGDSLEL